MSDIIHHGSALQEGVTGDPDTIIRNAAANGAPKPQSAEAAYLTADRVNHTRPLLDQPAEDVELFDPTT